MVPLDNMVEPLTHSHSVWKETLFFIFFLEGGKKIELNFSPECGIVELSLPLITSSSWPLNSILVLSVA